MVTDNFRDITVEDSEDFKNASFRALEILLNIKGPYTPWDEFRINEILDDFCKTVGQHWEKSYKDRQTLLKSYRVYFGQDIIFKKDSRLIYIFKKDPDKLVFDRRLSVLESLVPLTGTNNSLSRFGTHSPSP